MLPILFVFDLDGTLTRREVLPELAGQLGLAEEMRLLTRLTLEGVLDFAQSLRLRFAILRSLPLGRIHEIVESIPLEPELEAFIRARPKQCVLATGNVDVWIQPLVQRLGCTAYSSHATDSQLTHILDKGELARELKRTHRLVVVGDSDNDLPMLREADIAIAFGAAHTPLPHVQAAADSVAQDAKALREYLEYLANCGEEEPLRLPDCAEA